MWIILNSPSNPTGACYTEGDIKEIADVLAKHPQIHILSDDIYENVTYEGCKFFTIAQIDSLKERVLTMNGVSKAYSMTGWRSLTEANLTVTKLSVAVKSKVASRGEVPE